MKTPLKKIISQEVVRARETEKLLRFCPDPTRSFNVGDKITIGYLKNVEITEILNEGKIYEIEFESEKDGSRVRRLEPWYNVFKTNDNENPLFKEDNLRLNFTSSCIDNIIWRKYSYGIDLDPEYQRGYVWSPEDEEALIDSIFNNCDIGKFVLINKDCDDNPCYEVLDGKQRINTILRFFEDRFTYKGYLYSELSLSDRRKFKRFTISTAEIVNPSKEMIYQYFLKVNVTGKVMDKDHLKKVESLLSTIHNSMH